MKRLLLAILLLFIGCDSANVTGPTPTTTTVPTPTPIVRVDQPFGWSQYRGFSAFALFAHDEQEIRSTFNTALAHGWNTARVCAETAFWDGAYPYLQVKDDVENVRRGLEIIATIPEAQVLLISNCTLKRQVPIAEQTEWNLKIARVARDYKNVAIEVINEGDNCRSRDDWGGQASFCGGKQDWARWVHDARSAGVKNVTLDDSVCIGDFTLEFRFYNIGAQPADFHPCRNDPKTGKPWDPLRLEFDEDAALRVDNKLESFFSPEFLPKLIATNRGQVLLSETVAYSENTCTGLRTCDKNRIQSYINRCAANSGCMFTYHSAPWGLAGSDYTWWPEAK